MKNSILFTLSAVSAVASLIVYFKQRNAKMTSLPKKEIDDIITDLS